MKLIKLLKDIISPKKCYSCNKEWHFLCPECLWKIKKYKVCCYACKTHSDNFAVHKHKSCQRAAFYDKMIILTHYQNNVIKRLVKHSKYYSRKDILEDFAIYLSELFYKNEIILKNNKTASQKNKINEPNLSIEDFNPLNKLNKETKDKYLLVPVPMYFFRKFSRWYNHSELLAKNIWKITWIKVSTKLIKRIRNTRQQSKLSREDRLINLKDAFKVNKKQVDRLDKKIKLILIDDITSTWSTINEISEALRKAWIREIIGLCIASG